MSTLAKILIVDDEPFNVDYLEQLLTDLGCETVSAANGQEALERVTAEAPDLILLDVMMPVMDGFTVCRKLKENEETQLIPIVIMTALGAREDRIKGISAGADDFLTRPVNARELGARIETALKHKQAIDRQIRHTTVEKEQTATRDSAPPPGSSISTSSGQAHVAENLFRREGEFWTIAYQGTIFRLKDTKGLRYLAHLLSYPHKEFHVLDFLALDAAVPNESANAADPGTSDAHSGWFGDAGVMLDSKARAAYKQRLADLQREIEEAQAFHDLSRVGKLQRELDFVGQELAGATGLGGRNRQMISSAEQARINVTRVIKAAVRKIRENHRALGQHLTATVKTGVFCSYMPDPRLPVSWEQ